MIDVTDCVSDVEGVVNQCAGVYPVCMACSRQSSKSLLVVAADAWFLPVVAALIIMSCFSEGYLTD